jgi:hypothetical protein
MWSIPAGLLFPPAPLQTIVPCCLASWGIRNWRNETLVCDDPGEGMLPSHLVFWLLLETRAGMGFSYLLLPYSGRPYVLEENSMVIIRLSWGQHCLLRTALSQKKGSSNPSYFGYSKTWFGKTELSRHLDSSFKYIHIHIHIHVHVHVHICVCVCMCKKTKKIMGTSST